MKAVAALLLIVSLLPAQTASHSKKKPAAAVAQPEDDELTLPIVKLTVEGNERIPSDAILKMSDLKVGDIASKAAFDAAQQKILASGFFDKVNYGYGPVASAHPGFAAKFQVAEAKPLYKVQFAGFAATNQELNAYLKSRDALYNGFAPPTQQILDRWAKYLEAWTASKNQPKKIIGKLLPDATGNYFIQFQPDAPLPAVARVEFTGSESIDANELQKAIGAVAYGLPYSEQNFREFLDNQVRPLFEARGMLQVKFEDITSEPVPLPVKGLLVHVKVVEGPVFKLGRVFVSGVDEDDQDHLKQVAALKTGQVANFDEINAAADRIKHSVRRAGYFHVSTSVERKLDEAAKKVNVTVNVDRGPKYEYGKVVIQGLDLNGTAAVQKQWGKQPGDPYNPDYADYFLTQVKEEGIFDHMGPTRSSVAINDQTHVADVTLVFLPEEKKPKTDDRHHDSR